MRPAIYDLYGAWSRGQSDVLFAVARDPEASAKELDAVATCLLSPGPSPEAGPRIAQALLENAALPLLLFTDEERWKRISGRARVAVARHRLLFFGQQPRPFSLGAEARGGSGDGWLALAEELESLLEPKGTCHARLSSR